MTKILIIEDDDLNRRMYEKVFHLRGHDVALAVNGEDGLEKAASERPKLIMLDIVMPKMNGLDMLRKLKASPDLANIPVVALTNLVGKADAEAMLSAGAIRYVVKSDYSPAEVCDIAESMLDQLAAGKN